jgi:GLPGLI family protein
MKITLITAASLLLTANFLCAQQARFTLSGSIEFEKTVNMFAIIKKGINTNTDVMGAQVFDQYKKTQPQFKKLNSTLVFGDNKTLFVPMVKEDGQRKLGDNIPITTQFNLIYTDLTNLTSVTQKNVYEEIFLVKDSIRKINWKITDEIRVIAGYTCRRANAVVMDSVYVVAFYTNKIPVSGGPESFTGLPGMILGLALPHENVTWFATKVTDETIPINTITPPDKGTLVNNKELYDILKEVMKSRGATGPNEIKAFLL